MVTYQRKESGKPFLLMLTIYNKKVVV